MATPIPPLLESTAEFSPCRQWRYTLLRRWRETVPGGKGFAMFVGLNPSTADEIANDPTVRRCIGYALDWGYDGLCMTNIFAYRATDPEVMKAQDDPVGPGNDAALIRMAEQAGIVVAAWGTHGAYRDRHRAVLDLGLPKLHFLRLTQGGYPNHPLYLPKNLEPVPWC